MAGAGVPATASGAEGGTTGAAAAASGPGREQPARHCHGGLPLALPSPLPVRFLRLVIEGETVNVAYVGIAPRGKPSGRTVLLPHGKNFDGGAWEPAARACAPPGAASSYPTGSASGGPRNRP